MDRTCSACGGDLVPFAIPDDLRPHAPEGTDVATLCSRCLRTYPVDAATSETAGVESKTDALADYFPRGDGGAATALLVGMLDSLALHRAEIASLADRAEREGVDVLLTLDRIAADEAVAPHFDVDRRLSQVEQFLD